MKNSISFFLPTRKGSQRVKNKNVKNFAGIEGGLLALKLSQLTQSVSISEIILSTNDESCIEVALRFDDQRIKIIERPEELCLDTTPLTDLINYVPTVVNSQHVIWGHVTTPFIDGAEYDSIIESYFAALDKGYDSLVSVTELQNFLIDPDTGKITNSSGSGEMRWPRTQDLKPLYEVNHAAFVASVAVYKSLHDRIGNKKWFYIQDKLKSFDIDWPDDFLIAEAIQKQVINV